MQAERSFISAHHPEVLHTKTKKELFKEVIEAAHNGVRHNMEDYLSAFLNSEGYKLYVEKGEAVDSSKPLIVALNHHSRQRYFTTEESLRTVAIASVSARDHGVTEKHIAWMVRELPIPPVGIGKMARQVQNATGPVFDSVPAKTVKKLTFRRGIPQLRETMTKDDTTSLVTRVASKVQNGNALGIFPEQEPTFQLKPHHRNFERTLNSLKLLAPEYQIATLSVFYEGKLAHAIYGPVLEFTRESDARQTAIQVMQGIARNMPRDLRGPHT